MATNSTYHTAAASCPQCRSLDGQPRTATGNPARIEMGHKMYHTRSGRVSACFEALEQDSENLTPIEELNSAGIEAEAKALGISAARFLTEGGEGENHISVWELTGPDGFTFRVAKTNADPIWEEQDIAIFAELLESVGIDLA
jgi:hypothetical protein